jgi:hypothetical protein
VSREGEYNNGCVYNVKDSVPARNGWLGERSDKRIEEALVSYIIAVKRMLAFNCAVLAQKAFEGVG